MDMYVRIVIYGLWCVRACACVRAHCVHVKTPSFPPSLLPVLSPPFPENADRHRHRHSHFLCNGDMPPYSHRRCLYKGRHANLVRTVRTCTHDTILNPFLSFPCSLSYLACFLLCYSGKHYRSSTGLVGKWLCDAGIDGRPYYGGSAVHITSETDPANNFVRQASLVEPASAIPHHPPL